MDRATARKIAKAAFPEWRGRKLFVKVRPDVFLSDTFWSGGTRNDYVAVELATGRTAPTLPKVGTPREFGGQGGDVRVPIPEGVAIVEHSIFCGKDVGCTVYIRPAIGLETGVFQALEAP